ncbi:MAG TPA: thioredoxin [Candidatus Ventrousia excrementavium]|uniref:Thioredoxin n=1 Tax=Candidatus Ventrousia excrementavium TaxID=2840961 RepID=A0A9D1LLD6_9CLOT|nr:thioredoxin [Candidatus Ventrousia excrementavium]
MAVEHISQSNFDEVVSGTEVVLVDFFATWCNPCKILAPVLDQISESLPENRKIVKIDIDENMEAARKFGVMSIPTLILFKNGQAAQRLVGVRPEEEIRELLK